MIQPIGMPPEVTVGKIKSFGALGPKYEIQGQGRIRSGDWLVPIRLVETGEEVEYSYSRLQADPDAP